MVAREPSDTPTEEFVPDFEAPPPVASRLRASEAFTRRRDADDVGLRLFDDPDDSEDAGVTPPYAGPGDQIDDGDTSPESPDRRRPVVIASLVVVAALAGVLAGYVVVQAAGGWEAVWVTSGDGTGVEPSPDATPGESDLGQDPSASPSPSGSASPTPSGSGTPSGTPRPGQPGGGTPTGPDPDPTHPTRTPSPTPTPSDSPTEPQPTKSKPHDDD